MAHMDFVHKVTALSALKLDIVVVNDMQDHFSLIYLYYKNMEELAAFKTWKVEAMPDTFL